MTFMIPNVIKVNESNFISSEIINNYVSAIVKFSSFFDTEKQYGGHCYLIDRTVTYTAIVLRYKKQLKVYFPE